jgi:tRNA 2-selenouridine synthase
MDADNRGLTKDLSMQTTYTPLDLEVHEFSDYDLIIDARSPREFALDHLPGAQNYPVVNDNEYAQVGTLHRHDTHKAYLIGVTHSLRNMATWIEEISERCGPKSKILVYCFRGGKRSKLWADNLRTIGFKVDLLRGGWKAYRRWVIGGLEVTPRLFNFVVLEGPTGSGKTRLLKALHQVGGQVLDLEGLALHRGSLIGAIPGVPQPSQKDFDSQLLTALRSMDPNQPVFIEAESKKIGNVQLPGALMEAMQNGAMIRITSPMEERLKVWREDFAHFEADPAALLHKLEHLRPMVGNSAVNRWHELAAQKQVIKVFEELMVLHYDPAYERSNRRAYEGWSDLPTLEVKSLDPAHLIEVASDLLSKHINED